MRVLRCAPQIAATIASALLSGLSGSLLAEAEGRSGHYSVDDIIRKQEEVAAFEETFRKADAMIKKSRGGGDSSPPQERDGEAKGDNRRAQQVAGSEEAPSVGGEGQRGELGPRKLSKISKSSSKVDDSSSLRKELNQCLARTASLETEADQCHNNVESLETEIDEMKNDKNEEKYLYVQESESCEVTRKKKRKGKTVWKLESTNLNPITFRYTSIPYRIARKEPSYLFSSRFTSIFPEDGPNAVFTSGDETVVFYINKVEYEFDKETKTAKQVFEIEQSEVQEEVSPLSGLLGESSDGNTFEHCKFFIDDGTSALVNGDAGLYKIKNNLVARAAEITRNYPSYPEKYPDEYPDDAGNVDPMDKILPQAAVTFVGDQVKAIGTLVDACATNDSTGCNVKTISSTAGGFLIGASSLLAAAFPPAAAVLAVFGVVAELFSIFSGRSENTSIRQAQQNDLLSEISKVVTGALDLADINEAANTAFAEMSIVQGDLKTSQSVLNGIRSVTDQASIDTMVEEFYSQSFQIIDYDNFARSINNFLDTSGFMTTSTFDPIVTWIKSISHGGDCIYPIWPNIKSCNSKVTNAKATYDNVVDKYFSTYLAAVQTITNYASLVIKIFLSHSTCAEGLTNCLYHDSIRTVWNTLKTAVVKRASGLKKAMDTMKTCGPNYSSGAHPFVQSCNSNTPNECDFPYLTISANEEIESYVPSSAATKVYVGMYSSDAISECQNFVDATANVFSAGIALTAVPGTFTGCRFGNYCNSCDSITGYPGPDSPLQLAVGSDKWCVMPPPPQQSSCSTLVNLLDPKIGPFSYFAVYALKGYNINAQEEDGGALLTCQNAIQDTNVFRSWTVE